jgi:hypothetical protein
MYQNVKNTCTDEGDKPEKVYEYEDWDGFSDSDDSQESSPRHSGTCDRNHPAWRLYANPRMCMIIIQWASPLTTMHQPKHKLGGSH